MRHLRLIIEDTKPIDMADAELRDHIDGLRSKLKRTRGTHKMVQTKARNAIKKRQRIHKGVVTKAKLAIDKARAILKSKKNEAK